MDTKSALFHHPSHQLPILTSNVQNFIAQTRLLRSAEGPPSSIGLVVGTSGTGKTIAAHMCWETMEQEEHASCVIIDIMPQITAKGFLSMILHQFSENARPHTSHEALRQVIEVLWQGKTRLLILDQSDYLERSALEALALLAEKTPCSFLLVGLPHLRTHLNMVPSLAGRVGLFLDFRTLPEEEVYDVFLPQLVLPGWEFDPENEEDLYIGSHLWKYAQPSLRRVCMILSYASYLAQMSGSRKILLKDIRSAMSMTGLPDDHNTEKKRRAAKMSRRLGTDKHELGKKYGLEPFSSDFNIQENT